MKEWAGRSWRRRNLTQACRVGHVRLCKRNGTDLYVHAFDARVVVLIQVSVAAHGLPGLSLIAA